MWNISVLSISAAFLLPTTCHAVELKHSLRPDASNDQEGSICWPIWSGNPMRQLPWTL
jgi:hypothetical protein